MNTPLQNLTDDQRWQAVRMKDRSFDGAFVTAVRTTGIYCRPSCPARAPQRQNITFYLSPSEAEAHGFRPCKRCSPNTQAYEAEVVERVCRHIEAHLDERLTLNELGAAASLSPQHLQKVFKRALGISPREYADARRMEQLKLQLKSGETVTHALYEAGFSSTSRLYERDMGMTPATYRNGGKDMHIQYTIAACSLGLVLVGATQRGICAVSLGDSAGTLEGLLREDYPAAVIEADDGALAAWVDVLLKQVEGEAPHDELPLDIRGTAFQRRVWQALRRIPRGETRSYTQIAESIGQPEAARAVARACASNHVAVLIPCHRVVRQSGDLSGYRWGVARKAELLRREGAAG
jgi:AraC family transcriptional regulator of adaptative response/methylated-DNA-[protein]-cysteine methyltransferase